MSHVNIKCFPRALTDEQKIALAADITEAIIRHLQSKDSSVSMVLSEVKSEAWQAMWDTETASQMAGLIEKPGYSMQGKAGEFPPVFVVLMV